MFEYGHEVMIRYTHFFLFFILYLSLISYHFLHQQQNQNGLWKRALTGVQESKYFCLSGKKGSDLVLFSFGTKTPTQLAWFNCFFLLSLSFGNFPFWENGRIIWRVLTVHIMWRTEEATTGHGLTPKRQGDQPTVPSFVYNFLPIY